MPNPYHVFGSPPPQMLGRSRLAERVIDRLRTQHVSVVAPQYFGKTVFVRGLATSPGLSQHFSDIVYWDLRHLTPATDGDFFVALSDALRDQVHSCGDEPAAYFSAPGDKTAQAVIGFFDYLQAENKRVLLVMDGMDQPLGSANLSPSVWDNLCALTERNSVSMLTASRKRLRQLCLNPNSRTSDFWQRFVDPVELKALTREELREFNSPLAHHVGTLAPGSETEIWNWSGGLPLLTAALCERLFATVTVGAGLSPGEVVSAAHHVLSDKQDLLEALWQDLDTEVQTAFVDLAQRREISRGEIPGLAGKLVSLGLAQVNGDRLSANSRLLIEYSASRREGLAAMTVLFANRVDFEKNLRALVDLRFGHLTISDEDLRDFLSNAVEKVAQPKVCLAALRCIADRSLVLIWKTEASNGEVPRFTSPRGLDFMQNCHNNRLPTEPGKQCYCLDLLTDDRNGVTPRNANRKIFCLIDFLKTLGDLGQHQAGIQMDIAFSANACFAAILLADEMVRAGLA